jgi:hypothetical protein
MSIVGLALGSSVPAGLADQEAGNFAHVAAGPSGRCYAKSVPRHVYDPQGEVRQQGRTEVYRVTDSQEVLVSEYDWFSQQLFLYCGAADGITVVRVGPWQRGHVPEPEHLALAFYRDGKLLKRYSTLEIAATDPERNVAASVSHYSVFESWPDLVSTTTSSGPVFTETWTIRATTIDGRSLVFDLATGELLP